MSDEKIPDYALRKAIIATLEARGLSVYWLAKHTGVDNSNLSRWIMGVHDMSGMRVDACRKALGLVIVDPMQD